MDVWKDLEPLRKNSKVGIEQITFGVLWMLNGGMPGTMTCTAKMIREHFSRDPSSLRDQLEKLARLKLLRAIARERRQGTFLIRLELPLPIHADVRPDPQLRFALSWSDGVDDLRAWMNEHADELPPNEKKSDGDFLVASRGDFPATARGDFPATARGDFPAGAEREVSAGKPPPSERGDFPAGTSPRHINVNESNQELFNGLMKSNVNVQRCEELESSPAQAPGGDVALALAARQKYQAGQMPNAREIAACRRIAAGTSPAAVAAPRGEFPAAGRVEAKFTGSELAAAIEAKASPERQKGELVARIRDLVCDPLANHWIFRFAADLMLVHGRSKRADADAIWGKMEMFLKDLAGWREAEKRDGKTPMPLGRWLNKRVHEICAEHGILTPRDRKAARAAGGG